MHRTLSASGDPEEIDQFLHLLDPNLSLHLAKKDCFKHCFFIEIDCDLQEDSISILHISERQS